MNQIHYLFKVFDKLYINNEDKHKFIKLHMNKYNFFRLINLNNE